AQAATAETPRSDRPVRNDRRETRDDILYAFKRWDRRGGQAVVVTACPYPFKTDRGNRVSKTRQNVMSVALLHYDHSIYQTVNLRDNATLS
ncbi:hypothetical protein J8J17_22040, partial [Mycobacterium tuberculosis]|nr:hypothetical protein [Mycobacterium tuberculosis]